MTPTPLLVDGMNVIGSRPTGWWRDRDGAVRDLVDKLARLAATSGDEITVVFDGRPLPDLLEGTHAGVRVCYASRRGADAADDRIVELVAELVAERSAIVVTGDRRLRARVTALGASAGSPTALLDRLDSLAG